MKKKAKKVKKLTKAERHAIAQASRERNHRDPKQRTYVPKFYFAYGSNLNLRQMKTRCGTAKIVSAATLTGWKLTFRGVADIVPGKVDDIVYGAVFHIQASDERALDVYEGFPSLYKKTKVKVKLDNGKCVTAMVYIMNNSHNRGQNIYPPNESYFRSIHEGFANFRLPHVHLHDARKASHGIYEYHQAKKHDAMYQEELNAYRPSVDDFIEYVTDAEDAALVNWARNLNAY